MSVEPDEITTHDAGFSPETGQVWKYTQKIWRFDNGFGLNVITQYLPAVGMTDLWDAHVVNPGGEFRCPHGDVDRMLGIDDEKVADIVVQVSEIPGD